MVLERNVAKHNLTIIKRILEISYDNYISKLKFFFVYLHHEQWALKPYR